MNFCFNFLQKFTTMEVDTEPYEKIAADLSTHFAEEYVNYDEFSKLEEAERIRLVIRFMDENVVLSAQELWKANEHVMGNVMPIMALTKDEGKTPVDVVRNFQCAENLLSNINANARKDASVIRYVT